MAEQNIFDDLPKGGLIVGAIMREPPETTLGFVRWYLGQGADRIIICFDDPKDPAIAALEHEPHVICIRCTRRFWATLGVRAKSSFPRRQNLAMQFIYRKLDGGWFLNVDGDELVWLKGRSLRAELDQTPEDVRSVTIRPAEALQVPDPTPRTHFRLPMSLEATQEVYGTHFALMKRRQGLCGHTVGKTVSRGGIQGVIMRQHYLKVPNGPVLTDRVIGHAEGAYLLHFFDQGFDVWRDKLEWRMTSRGFLPRVTGTLKRILASDDPEAGLRALYEALHVFDKERRDVLKKHDALIGVDLDFGLQRGIAA